MTVFDGHSLRVLFHFARDSPPSRPDVLVVIISMLSSAPVPVTGITFRVTAPKVSAACLPSRIGFPLGRLKRPSVCVLLPPQTMAVKLQPPSGTELPAFNPILPPAAVTQILLLANPNKVRPHLDTATLTMCVCVYLYIQANDHNPFQTAVGIPIEFQVNFSHYK